MAFAVVLVIWIGLALLALVLLPAVLVAWVLRRAAPAEEVELRPGDAELTLAAWIGRESAAIRLTR